MAAPSTVLLDQNQTPRGSRGRQEERFLLRPLTMAAVHQRDNRRDGFPKGRYQTSV